MKGLTKCCLGLSVADDLPPPPPPDPADPVDALALHPTVPPPPTPQFTPVPTLAYESSLVAAAVDKLLSGLAMLAVGMTSTPRPQRKGVAGEARQADRKSRNPFLEGTPPTSSTGDHKTQKLQAAQFTFYQMAALAAAGGVASGGRICYNCQKPGPFRRKLHSNCPAAEGKRWIKK
ncbi:hypothetical protein J4Q44_G00248260 [Coregonus suidteri]|uniref:Uncharacterized protein n=1 Tax=Coregonus suidteri TaxID=861788 RepID=A0AAN8LDM2_9TELE